MRRKENDYVYRSFYGIFAKGTQDVKEYAGGI